VADSAVLENLLVAGSLSCVRLHVAASPSLTPALAARLLRDSSPYVRAVAAGHPAASADGLRRLAEGMSEPAWVLRAIAGNPSCPADLSDELLTWVALGGSGPADPMFDPVECTGHPADTRFSPLAWYREQAKSEGAESHPLWLVRAQVMSVAGRLPGVRAWRLARDPRPEVRRSIARAARLPTSIRSELLTDSDPQVAKLAANAKPVGVGASRRGLAVLGSLFLLVAGLGIVQHVGSAFQATAGQSRHASHGRMSSERVPSRQALPGGGGIRCEPLAYGRHAVHGVYVVAGTAGLTLHVTGDSLMTAGGADVHSPVIIPAGGQRLFLLYGPTLVSITAGRDGGSPAGSASTLFRCG
jgi:hypothetical protein